jgi:hypothetical protein
LNKYIFHFTTLKKLILSSLFFRTDLKDSVIKPSTYKSQGGSVNCSGASVVSLFPHFCSSTQTIFVGEDGSAGGPGGEIFLKLI